MPGLTTRQLLTPSKKGSRALGSVLTSLLLLLLLLLPCVSLAAAARSWCRSLRWPCALAGS
jgi:hypothetical protein